MELREIGISPDDEILQRIGMCDVCKKDGTCKHPCDFLSETLIDPQYPLHIAFRVLDRFSTDYRYKRGNLSYRLRPDHIRFYKDGRLHRDRDMPAIVSYRRLQWFCEGKLHRENDNPAVVDLNGAFFWFRQGIPHREKYPAIIRVDGHMEWWMEGRPKRRVLREGKETFIDKHITLKDSDKVLWESADMK